MKALYLSRYKQKASMLQQLW